MTPEERKKAVNALQEHVCLGADFFTMGWFHWMITGERVSPTDHTQKIMSELIEEGFCKVNPDFGFPEVDREFLDEWLMKQAIAGFDTRKVR